MPFIRYTATILMYYVCTKADFTLVKTSTIGNFIVHVLKWKLRHRPHYAREIYTGRFISAARPALHTNPEKLTTENRAFPNVCTIRRNLNFKCEQKASWKRSFWETSSSRLTHNLKVAAKYFCRRWLLRFEISSSVDGKQFLYLQSKNAVFEFLQRSVHGAWGAETLLKTASCHLS